MFVSSSFMAFVYILTSVLFILSIRGLSSPKTARKANLLGIFAMFLVLAVTFFSPDMKDFVWPLIVLFLGAMLGSYMAIKVKMTALPQMVALFNGLGGLSAVFIALAEILHHQKTPIETSLGMIIGALAFSGSMIAFAKLQGLISPKALGFKYLHSLNLILAVALIGFCVAFCWNKNLSLFYILAALSLILGFLLVLPIGGADMPVIISVLNAYSGWAAVGIGFSLNNVLLIIVGAIVGASGAILSYIMVKAMNRSLWHVMSGGMNEKKEVSSQSVANHNQTAKVGSPEDAAFIMENSSKVIIVPGYGMAVAQAQHVLRTMAKDLAEKFGVEVKFAIHPVAGRMPGHMNVLLAEANVDYEDVFEMDAINHEFETADVAFVIGANDVTNPLAKTDASSPIFGMPVLEVGKAKTVFFVKRSLNSGYSGVDNPLFYADNTLMLYGDAKHVTEQIVAVLEQK